LFFGYFPFDLFTCAKLLFLRFAVVLVEKVDGIRMDSAVFLLLLKLILNSKLTLVETPNFAGVTLF